MIRRKSFVPEVVPAYDVSLDLPAPTPASALNIIEESLDGRFGLSETVDPLPAVPSILKQVPNWVEWRLEGKKGKLLKMSGTKHSRNAESDNSATWVSYETLIANSPTINSSQGVGFVLNGEQSKCLVAYDIDGARNAATGEIAEWAKQILVALGNPYTEVTPSGTGIRPWVIGRNAFPGDHLKEKLLLAKSCGFGDKVQIEIFRDGQYVTVTGNHLAGTSREIPNRGDLSNVFQLCETIAAKYPSPVRTKKQRNAKLYVGGKAIESSPNPGFKALFEAVGFDPLVRRLNKHIDPRFHDMTLGVGEPNTYCPIPSHGEQDVNVEYQPCFGVIAGEPAVLHCFGCDWSGDMVAACYEVDGDDTKSMYDVARAICTEENLKFENFFPQSTPVKPTVSESQEWGVPAEFQNFLLPVEPFDINFLPHALQGWVKDVSERMSVPLDFTGICALVTMAGAVNRRVFIYPKERDKEWKEALAISGAVVALSGKLKTPTWKCFTNIHVELEYDWRKYHDEKMAVYLQAFDKYKKQTKQMRKDKASEDAIAALEQPVKPEPARRLLVNDATPEKLHTIMQECPEGLLVFRDELSGWIAEMDKEGREAEREIFLCAMNGDDPYTMDRIERGTVTAIMSASLFGGIQPDKLIEFLNDPNNVSDGTFPRFGAVVWPDSSEMPLVDRPVNTTAKEQSRRLIRTLANTKAKAAAFHFAPTAQARFNEWLRAHNVKVAAETNSGKQSHLSKYRGLLPKVAGLFQLADIVTTSQVQPSGEHLVDLEHLEKAIRFLVYLESHVNRIYAQIRNPFQKADESLARRIKAGDLKDGFTVRDIERKGWDGLSKREYVEDAITTLEEKNWIRELPLEKNNKGGRPTRKWEINPTLK